MADTPFSWELPLPRPSTWLHWKGQLGPLLWPQGCQAEGSLWLRVRQAVRGGSYATGDTTVHRFLGLRQECLETWEQMMTTLEHADVKPCSLEQGGVREKLCLLSQLVCQNIDLRLPKASSLGVC